MQLCYEKSWAKALSTKDRQIIENVYAHASTNIFSTIRHAVNHRGHLLVTVLIRNTNDEKMSFFESKLAYVQHDDLIATQTFTIPALVVPPHSAMPWTFIFSEMHMSLPAQLGQLQWINAQY